MEVQAMEVQAMEAALDEYDGTFTTISLADDPGTAAFLCFMSRKQKQTLLQIHVPPSQEVGIKLIFTE